MKLEKILEILNGNIEVFIIFVFIILMWAALYMKKQDDKWNKKKKELLDKK